MGRSARRRALLGVPLTRGSAGFFVTLAALLLLVLLAIATWLEHAL